jgi:hypothetical protein
MEWGRGVQRQVIVWWVSAGCEEAEVKDQAQTRQLQSG